MDQRPRPRMIIDEGFLDVTEADRTHMVAILPAVNSKILSWKPWARPKKGPAPDESRTQNLDRPF